jgi:putative hydrolase of the HAD superfamily
MLWIFFDIDNTLYDQQSYLRQVSQEIALHFGKKRYYRDLMQLWKKRGTRHPTLFNEFLTQAGIFSPQALAQCIRIFHAPRHLAVSLYPDARVALETLTKGGVKLGVITDGNRAMQELKFKRLGLTKFFKNKNVYYTDRWNLSKADPHLFARIAKLIPKNDERWYVGDNPFTDFKNSKKAGFKTVRILRGEFRSMPAGRGDVDYQIDSLRKLPALIGRGK